MASPDRMVRFANFLGLPSESWNTVLRLLDADTAIGKVVGNEAAQERPLIRIG